eukprot:TRINITY_DN4651_c0_g2_i1.p1 TRINITY_DN4651_c0_g2~~TRINITY_DN4651_c0_g2_i1.p1  ORF type:complete len:353 (+),score=76.41 TRINITY_DN4651_c0_g2_i1:46-1059(+)
MPDRRRRRRSTSTSSSSASSRRAKRRAKRTAGSSLWGSMEEPGLKGAPVPEGAVKGHAQGVTFVANPGSDAALQAAAMRQAVENSNLTLDDEAMALSGSQAKIALMHKLQQSRGVGGNTAAALPVPTRPVERSKRAKPELLNPLMAGPGRRNMAGGRKESEKPKEDLEVNTFAKRTAELDVPQDKRELIRGLGERHNCVVTLKEGDWVKIKGPPQGVEAALRDFAGSLGSAPALVSDGTASSRVMALSNMVARPEDIDDDLVNSIKQECQKFGPVSNLLVYDEHQHDGSIVSKVLVQFQFPTSIVRCLSVMGGRLFDGRRLKAEYFCEDAFDGILAS